MVIASTRPIGSRIKVVDEIIESLRQQIVSGKLGNGARLPTEKELAQQYAVSQPTIREGIRALETLGLVEVQHGSGTFVRSQGGYALALSLQTLLQLEGVSILEVLQVRQLLGRQSIQTAAQMATDEEVERIRLSLLALDRLEEVSTVEEVLRRVIDFQRTISVACRNPLLHTLEVFLVTLLLEVQVIPPRKRGVKYWRERAVAFQNDRRKIFEGIEAHNISVAVAAMESYFEHQRERFVEDKALGALNLSDPRLIEGLAEMVRQMKTA
ncbi:FadR/GntR family transcriptional regulator [Novosphingobium terrae]|uniref:FadR/GntR family transcriptional regulator n=1 Tax=Novosphingobium terrae TaxID=2726189 RepID=UPI00197E83EB|nr:FadR/GntR family transcriptional regulator [Novosphingobium terrae]